MTILFFQLLGPKTLELFSALLFLLKFSPSANPVACTLKLCTKSAALLTTFCSYGFTTDETMALETAFPALCSRSFEPRGHTPHYLLLIGSASAARPSSMPGTVLPQGLCTCRFRYLGRGSACPHGGLSPLLQAFV